MRNTYFYIINMEGVNNLTGELDGCYSRQMIPEFLAKCFFSDPFTKTINL